MTGRPTASTEKGEPLLVAEDLSRWYPETKRWRPPKYLRWLPTGPVGGAGVDEDGLDDLDDAPDEEQLTLGDQGVRGVSFELWPGEGLGLVGTDEVAKDSLLRVLSGLVPPTSGRIVFRGRVVSLFPTDFARLTPHSGLKGLLGIAVVMGWPKRLVRERREEIFAFANAVELPQGRPSERARVRMRRLITAVALHVDATVYVQPRKLGGKDTLFEQHVIEALAERRAAGCAIVQAGDDVEDIVRLCDTALWLHEGTVLTRGRPAELEAVAAAHGALEKPPSGSVAADPVQIGPDGGSIDVALDLHSARTELDLVLVLSDDRGERLRIRQPDALRADGPGTYDLRITVPGGLLGDEVYQAVLLGSDLRATGKQRALGLVSFDLISRASMGEEPPTDIDPEFQILPTGDDLHGRPSEVRWDVRRAHG
jgi:ABC-type polysaccharide/polyol phosphate transport system ATPase subunit